MKVFSSWIQRNYGTNRGMMRCVSYQLEHLIQRKYRDLSCVEWHSVSRLVFVCKGNICRSAYSQAVAEKLSVPAISCGVDTQNGCLANPDAVRIAASRGVDLSDHRTNRIQDIQKQDGDLFIAMEPWHIKKIHTLDRDYPCTLLGLWAKPVMPYIHDPYGACDAYFHYCFNYLEKAINEIACKLK